jgi:PAS domain S-box-containing protein
MIEGSKEIMMATIPVLVVDDNEANLKVARFALEAGGYEVRVALDGEAALEVLRSFQPRLILMDIQLPGIDGLELTRRLKARPATRDIVIVAVTAYAMKGDREKALAAGCDGYIAKPLDPIALPDQIGEYLGRAAPSPVALTPDIAQPPGPASSSDAAAATPAGDKAPILLVEDNPTTRKMFRVALESAGYRIVEAQNARTGLDAVARIRPALVIQDLLLPDMDGLDLAGELRQRLGASVPIVCVSGFLSRLDQARAMRDGFAHVFVKPVDPLQLIDTVRLLLAELPTGAAVGGAGQRLLVVDDDPLQCKLTTTWLSSVGFDVLTASSGPAALDLVRRERPAAVVSDVLMPGMDGYALCLAMRRDEQIADVPVILLSASYVEDADRRLAERVGASALLSKSDGIDAVVHALSAALGEAPPRLSDEPVELIQHEHVQRALWQLERQVQENARLQQRCALQEAQLTVLAGVAEALATHRALDEALGDVLAACLDMAGITKGALYLAQADSRLALAQQTGFSEAETARLRASFGCEALLSNLAREGKVVVFPSGAVLDDAARQITAQAGVTSLLLVPVTWEHTTFGALLLGARTADFAAEDALAFARVLGAQLGQTLGLARSFSRLRASEERHAAIIGSAMDAIITIDAEQRIAMFNPAAERMFGHRADAVMGQPLECLLPQRYRARHAEHVRSFGATGVTGRRMGALGSLAGLHADGEEFPIEASISQLEADGGKLYTVIVRDIAERLRAERDLQALADTLERRVGERTRELSAARDAADAASRAKSQFLANMSHEIRTPMNAILGLAHMLAREEATPRQAGQLSRIEGAARHLLTIINDILDLSRVDAGKLQLEERDFELPALLEQVRSIVGEGAAAKGLRVEVDAGTAPRWLRGDETRVCQALLNYASNAVKFTPQGRIVLRAKPLQERQTRLLVRFEVEDTGVGVDPQQLPRLFEAFEQADASTTREHGGTGLGLAITRRLAELMGGSAGAEVLSGGSLFWFTAWLGRGDQVKSDAAAPARPDAELRLRHAGARVLVAEDNLVNREVALALLRAAGLQVDFAEDGVVAVEKAGQGDYDLVLMDMQMPVMDGLQAARALRALPGLQTLPILAMTANAFGEDRAACLAAGMDDFVTKPVEPQTLYATLLKWLDRRSAAQAAAVPISHRESRPTR